MHFGDRSLNGVLLKALKDQIGIAARTGLSLGHIGGGAENLTLGSVGLGSHTSQLLFDHAELVQELAKSFALGGIGCGQFQYATRTTHGSCTQLQASNIED